MRHTVVLVICLVAVVAFASSAWAQTAPAVSLDILNEPTPGTDEIIVFQGNPVLVAYNVDPGADTSASDLIQLRRVDDASLVSDVVRGGDLWGTVSLDTSPANALGELQVIYVLAATGGVLAVAEETVLVVNEIPPEPPDTVEFPGGAPSLQAAIDLVGHGGTVEVAAGVYEITEPVFVQHKSVVLAGAGSGRKGEGPITHLVGPPPQPVVDEGGNLLLLADDVQGLLNIVGSDVVVQDIALSGFDAGIVTLNGENGEPATAVAEDIVITDTGRGILALSSGDIVVADATISDTSWNGISVAPRLAEGQLPPTFIGHDFNISHPLGAGIYFAYTHAFIDDADVFNADNGGIVGFRATAEIRKSLIYRCRKAGIVLNECHPGDLFEVRVEDNSIVHTIPYYDGNLGDGITLWLSEADIVDNFVYDSARAGISLFGAAATVTDNIIRCQLFDLAGNPWLGVDYAYHGQGNSCGCDAGFETCIIDTGTMEAPDPVGGLE